MAAGLVLSGSVAAFANDSTMLLKAGGIELVPNPWVTMEQETLTIGPKRIDVHYLFRNTSEEDRSFYVAFPFPDIVGNDVVEIGLVMADEKGDNFVDFTVTADGRKIAPSVELRAYANGIEVTGDLQKFGLPLNPRFAESDQLAKLPPATRKDFAERGIARYFSDTEAYASWDLKTTFYWRQDFPKDKPVTIEHSYVPVPGLGFFEEQSREYDPWLFTDYCISEETTRAALALKKTITDPSMSEIVNRRIVEYILTTGNNWQSSIGKFKLVVDTGDPRHLMSTCFRGLKLTAPGRYEFQATDFEPDRDLGVVFLELPEPEPQ
jgi:hypothetical protein